MGYYLKIDNSESEPLASGSGMGDLRRWAESLDDHEPLRHFAEYGWYEPVAELADDLRHALKESPPQESDVKSTADNLLSMLTGQQAAGVAYVMDGMGEDDGIEDEQQTEG